MVILRLLYSWDYFLGCIVFEFFENTSFLLTKRHTTCLDDTHINISTKHILLLYFIRNSSLKCIHSTLSSILGFFKLFIIYFYFVQSKLISLDTKLKFCYKFTKTMLISKTPVLNYSQLHRCFFSTNIDYKFSL